MSYALHSHNIVTLVRQMVAIAERFEIDGFIRAQLAVNPSVPGVVVGSAVRIFNWYCSNPPRNSEFKWPSGIRAEDRINPLSITFLTKEATV